jgi:hypothetical protein
MAGLVPAIQARQSGKAALLVRGWIPDISLREIPG